MDRGMRYEEELNNRHQQTMQKLQKEMNIQQSKLNEEEKKNLQLEKDHRKVFNGVQRAYQSNMEEYDKAMFDGVNQNALALADYEDTATDLRELEAELHEKLEQRRKKEELQAILAKKKDEQKA